MKKKISLIWPRKSCELHKIIVKLVHQDLPLSSVAYFRYLEDGDEKKRWEKAYEDYRSIKENQRPSTEIS
jgi:hypothetical protein